MSTMRRRLTGPGIYERTCEHILTGPTRNPIPEEYARAMLLIDYAANKDHITNQEWLALTRFIRPPRDKDVPTELYMRVARESREVRMKPRYVGA